MSHSATLATEGITPTLAIHLGLTEDIKVDDLQDGEARELLRHITSQIYSLPLMSYIPPGNLEPELERQDDPQPSLQQSHQPVEGPSMTEASESEPPVTQSQDYDQVYTSTCQVLDAYEKYIPRSWMEAWDAQNRVAEANINGGVPITGKILLGFTQS